MRGKQTQWQQWQLDYLIANFADTKNEELTAHIGVSLRTMHRMASALGLRKSPEFMVRCHAATVAAAAAANRETGGNAGKINLLRNCHRFWFRKGETLRDRIGEERERESRRKSREKRNETIRKERMRINWGLEQRTRMKLVCEPTERTSYRNRLKKRGYIVPAHGSRVVYYTDETQRSALVERRATSHGLIIKPYNNEILLQR